MLLANISVARKIFEDFPDSALLRRHPTPPPQNFENLQRALAPLNTQLDIESSLTLARSLDKAVLPQDPYFNTPTPYSHHSVHDAGCLTFVREL